MSACIRALATILVVLHLFAASAYPQSKRKSTRQPSHLYQVSTTDKQTGEKRIGFIDKTGKLVIDFDRLPRDTIGVRDFHEGRALIYLKPPSDVGPNGYHVGYIDMEGKMVIAPAFRFGSDFSEGWASAVSEDFTGFIDRWGKPVIKLVDTNAEVFHEGLAVAGSDRSRGLGYIDRSGKMVIEGHYRFADDFSEGRAGAVIDGKYGFIDKQGKLVIPARFDVRLSRRHPEAPISSGRFKEGLACVALEGSFGYINKQGDFVIPPKFSQAEDFSEGLAWVVTKNRTKAGWIDKSGKWIVTGIHSRGSSVEFAPQGYYSELRDRRYSEGLVPFVFDKGNEPLWGYLDRNGNIAIEPRQFSDVGPFVGGVARVSFFEESNSSPEKTAGYIDHTGQFMEEKYVYINRTGRFIWRSK